MLQPKVGYHVAMKIGIIGPGKLGNSLFALLSACGHHVRLYGRSEQPDEPVVLLTVPDRNLQAVAATITPGRVLLHCSGASNIDILRPHQPAGSFHPLMTFPGVDVGLPCLKGVPFKESHFDGICLMEVDLLSMT